MHCFLLKISLIHHLDMPLIRHTSFNVAPGTENRIAVIPVTTYTTKNALARFNPEERDCYNDDEISLKYLPRRDGYRYGIGNCLFEAAFENILERCKCYPGYSQGLVYKHNLDIKPCSGTNLNCMNDILLRIGKYDQVNDNGKMMKCRSSCQDQSNTIAVTTSSFPNEKTFRHRESFCMIVPRLLQKCEGFKRRPLEKSFPNICSTLQPLRELNSNDYCNENRWNPTHQRLNCTDLGCAIEDAILEYGRKNLALFHVLIRDPYSQRYRRDEEIAITSFIGNLGGLLGLYLGFSWISGAEIIFYLTKGIFSLIFKRRRAEESKNKWLKEVVETNGFELESSKLDLGLDSSQK